MCEQNESNIEVLDGVKIIKNKGSGENDERCMCDKYIKCGGLCMCI